MPKALEPEVNNGAGTEVVFNWINNSAVTHASDDDKTIMVVYCGESNQCIHDFGASRRQGTDVIDVFPFAGKKVETWLAFMSKDTRTMSDSIYTGTLEIPKKQ